MPQLMPLNWMFSSIMLLIILIVVCIIYSNSNNSVSNQNFISKSKNNLWFW